MAPWILVKLFFVLCETNVFQHNSILWKVQPKKLIVLYNLCYNSIFCIWRNTIPKQKFKQLDLHASDHDMWKIVVLSLFFIVIYCLCVLILFIWYKWIHLHVENQIIWNNVLWSVCKFALHCQISNVNNLQSIFLIN